MKTWQRYWLYLVIVYALAHLVRDVLQDMGVKVWLSTFLVKHSANPLVKILWLSFNTYVIAVSEIILATVCLKRNKFAGLGAATIILAVITLVTWSIYWFLL